MVLRSTTEREGSTERLEERNAEHIHVTAAENLDPTGER